MCVECCSVSASPQGFSHPFCCCAQNNDTDRNHTKKMEVVSGAVGSGLHRKLIFGSGVRIDKSR